MMTYKLYYREENEIYNTMTESMVLFEQDHRSPQEIHLSGEEKERLEAIPLELIREEESITDRYHMEKLRPLLLKPLGQINPITVRYLPNGNSIYDIIDGFHRVPLMADLGWTRAKASVVYNLTEEEMNDLRVAASTVEAVQFARMVKWMRASYEHTEWHQRGINLSTIIGMAHFNTIHSKFGMNINGLEEAKLWAKVKAEKWGRNLGSLYELMRVADLSSPALIERVRKGGGWHPEDRYITYVCLKAIAEPLYRRHNLQERVAAIVMQHNLNASDTRLLAKAVAEAKGPEIIADILFRPLDVISDRQPKKENTRPSKPRRAWRSYGRDENGNLKSQSTNGPIAYTEKDFAYWWRLPQIGWTDREQIILSLLIEENLDFEDTSLRLNVDYSGVVQLFQSALRKYAIWIQDHFPIEELPVET